MICNIRAQRARWS